MGLAYYQAAHVRPHLVAVRQTLADAQPEDRTLSAAARADLVARLEPNLGRYPAWVDLFILGRQRERQITVWVTKATLFDRQLTHGGNWRWHTRQTLWLLTFPPLLSEDDLVTLYCHHLRHGGDRTTCAAVLAAGNRVSNREDG